MNQANIEWSLQKAEKGGDRNMGQVVKLATIIQWCVG